MRYKGFKNIKLICEDEILENLVVVFGETVENICEINSISKQKLSEIEWINGNGLYLSPGFIDIHIHGSGGFDTMDSDPSALNSISKTVSMTGTTAFLPTTVTMDYRQTVEALKNIRENMINGVTGAKILGAHLEGPLINSKYKGAHEEKFIKNELSESLLDFQDILKIVTLAPEKEYSKSLIKRLVGAGITVSMGHTGASFEEAINGINYGISHATHVFNAMKGLHHREPGALGAALTSNISCEIIADTIHVHKALFSLFAKAKNNSNGVLITDAMRASGLGSGHYKLGNLDVIVDENCAKLPSGVLAGSILTMDKAIKNFKEHTNMRLCEVVKMATINPSKVIGLETCIGKIQIGYKSDFVLFDENIEIHKTIVDGQIVYEK